MKTTIKTITPFIMGVLLIISSCGQTSSQQNTNVKSENNKTMETEQTKYNLQSLFKAELQYDNTVTVNIPTEGRTGDRIGTGKGRVTGQITGEIFWQFYAEDCAYLWVKEGKEPPANQHLCKTNPGGVIKTSDGAEIQFDAKGYGFRGYNSDKPHLWKLTAALQFHTEDERYKWLNTALGIWEGDFNEKEGSAVYNAYIQK